jgi:ATP-binding cassette subfamily B protein
MMTIVNAKEAFLFLIRLIRPFKFNISVMFMVAIFWAIDLSVRPYLLKIILNRLTNTSPSETFHILLIPILAYLGMGILLSFLYRMYGYFVEIKMIPYLRQNIAMKMFNHLLGHCHSYYQDNFAGSLTNKVNDLINSIHELLQLSIDRIFCHILALGIAIFAMSQVHMKFALSLGIWAILFSSFTVLWGKKLTCLADKWSETASMTTGKLVDALSNILSIRLFCAEKQEKKSFHKAVSQTVAAEQNMQWAYFYIWLFYAISFAFLLGISIYFLLTEREKGHITVGDFALILTLNLAIANFFWELTRDFSQLSKHLGKVIQALRVTSLPHAITDVKGATSLKVSQGKIVFEQVIFQYKEAQPLFQNLSLTIAAGQKVGLVGYSGSGKSTFVNLILRLYDVQHGRILIDTQDIGAVTQSSLRQAIALIPQEPSLFHRTLEENLRYGRWNAEQDEILTAAKKAHAQEFIVSLPQGYQSLVGERGIKLSGGQRQRISIARAFLKNAPILILDEATSQMDSVTESLIQESLWELMEGKTTLVIAHRLSTLLHMDRILVFDNGKIVEDGNHPTLLKKGGLYKTLWESQVGGFLPEHQNQVPNNTLSLSDYIEF